MRPVVVAEVAAQTTTKVCLGGTCAKSAKAASGDAA